MSQFDEVIERRNTGSLKWDYCEERLGKKDILPMWVADMDFASPQAVIDEINKRTNHRIFGYTNVYNELNEEIVRWYQKRNQWSIQSGWLVHTPGVVTSICNAVLAYTKEGDKIVIQTPVYYPFYSCIEDNNRIVSKNSLVNHNGHYEIDFQDLEQKLADDAKMMILCSPHNPIGRVWTRAELTKIADLCLAYDVLLLSDEIHSDLVFSGHKHIPIATLSDSVAQSCVTLHSPTKTFNIAGLAHSFAIIQNETLRKQFQNSLNRTGANMLNIYGLTGALAVYEHGEAWLEELLQYLTQNLDTLVKYFETKIPEIKVIRPESTYLVWLDCREIEPKAGNLKEFFVHKANVGMNDGSMFGVEGKGFQRINFACPRPTLMEGLTAIENAVQSIR